MNTNPVPVTLITGFLGAGKTTLLNKLMGEGALKDCALIINEFGDVGIDHLLVESADEGIVELSDGCLCCTIRGDLIDTFTNLLNRSGTLERIVIETTGLADPAPILHAVMGHPVLSEKLRLDGVITLVDAVNGSGTLNSHEEAIKQAAVADRIVLTKTDLVDDIDELKNRLISLNPAATLLIADQLNDLKSSLFNCGLYDPETKSADVGKWLGEEDEKTGHHHHHNINRHDGNIRAFTLKTDKAVDAATLTTFIDLLRSAHGPNLLRVKGIIAVTEHPEKPVVIHGVQQIFHPPATLPSWPDDNRETRIVMITKDLSENFVRRLFDAFMGNTKTDTPDRQSLGNNPLTVAGFNGRFS